MQLAVPIAVNAAVRIDTINCITVFHVSFFIVLPFLLNSFISHLSPLPPPPSLNREGRGGSSILRHQDS